MNSVCLNFSCNTEGECQFGEDASRCEPATPTLPPPRYLRSPVLIESWLVDVFNRYVESIAGSRKAWTGHPDRPGEANFLESHPSPSPKLHGVPGLVDTRALLITVMITVACIVAMMRNTVCEVTSCGFDVTAQMGSDR